MVVKRHDFSDYFPNSDLLFTQPFPVMIICIDFYEFKINQYLIDIIQYARFNIILHF